MPRRIPAPLAPASRFALVTASLAVAALAAAAALAGCGGKAVREPGHHVTITLDDYLLKPQDVSVPAGRITVTIVNRGRIAHGFRVRKNANPASHVLLLMYSIKPGQRATASFHAKPGRYRMFCAIANHEELGMWGTLVVRR